MASNHYPTLLHCTGCHEELNLESSTLPCLHSFCRTCLDMHFEGETKGNCRCPECHELVKPDQLRLSPFLVKSLKRRQLESTVWKCDLCFEDGIESTAINWCCDCQKLHCMNCSRIHKKLQKEFLHKHEIRDLNGMETDERDKVIKLLMTDMCSLHKKAKDLYCEQCNMCLCDTCYRKHSADSPGCSSQPLSVSEEALKQKLQAPTLAKEMDDFEMNLRRLNENTRNYTEELNSDCHSKCRQIWKDFEEMMENARQKTNELCEEMKQITAEQVKRWCHLLEENENILKQLEIWRMNLHHLLNESQQDVDIVCGFSSLRSILSSKINQRTSENCQLEVRYPKWWLQVLEQLKSKKIGLVSLTVEELPLAKNLVLDTQFNLTGSGFYISSIQVSEEDNHIFLCNHTNSLIIELTEQGDLLCECKLIDPMFLFGSYQPLDMCFISPDILVVTCDTYYRLIFLERRKNPPFLQIKQIIDTERKFRSLCKINESIILSDMFFQIDSLSKQGRKIKTLKTGESQGYVCPRIRADPKTRNFWWTDRNVPEIFCFNSKGKKLQSVKTEKEILEFHMNQFGHLYFCNRDGIFSFPTEKNLYEFEEKSVYDPLIFILRNKMFLAVSIDGKWSIRIFKML